MAMDFTTSYAQIVKFDKNDDGTVYVYGKATDDTLDLDSQICDPKWLDTAMPRWFKSGGNIREMHGPSAAGIAKEYEAKGDGHYINVLVVDPVAAKKVETGVYQGFSIGIKSPRVIQDSKAANGRIIDGQIIEVSLVDRPANPSAKLILAKTVEGEATLVQVEEAIEKHGDHDQSSHGGGGGEGKPSEGTPRTEDHDKPNMGLPHGSDKIESAKDDARSLHQSLQNNPQDDPSRDRAAKDVMKARENLERAYNAETKEEAKGSLKDALKDTNRAFNLLEDQNYKGEAQAAHELAISITQALVAVKSVESDSPLTNKHGDHDQADHNPNGGGGGSSASTESAGRELGDIQDRMTNEYNAAWEENKPGPGKEPSGRFLDIQQAKEDADSRIQDAHESLLSGDKDSAAESLRDAASTLTDGTGRTFAGSAESLRALADNLQSKNKSAQGAKMEKINQITELAKSLTTVDAAKFDKTLFDNARRALAELIAAEALEMSEGHDERYSLAALADAVNALMNWYEGEEQEGEVREIIEEEVKADMPDCTDGKCGKCAACMSADKAVKEPDTTEEEESDQAPDTQEDDDEVDIDDKEKKKSADVEEPVVKEDSAADEVTETPAEETPAEATSVEDVVEKAVKSAMESVKAEIESLRADKEAAVAKSVELESELATALSKTVAGGPKRTATKLSEESRKDTLVKASILKSKAEATTDPLLRKGWLEMYQAEIAKYESTQTAK